MFGRRLMVVAVLLHLTAIGSVAMYRAVTPRETPSETETPGIAFSVVRLYTLCAVLNADYGFFTPEIGAAQELELEVINAAGVSQSVALAPDNREVQVRFNAMLLIFTRDRPFQELVARSIAALVYREFPHAVQIRVSLYRFDLPASADYRAGERPTRTLFFRSIYATQGLNDSAP